MISSYVNFAGVGCMRDVIVLEIKKDYNFKCRAYVNHQINKAENCPGIDLNYHFLEIVEKLCYFDNTIGTGGVPLTVLQQGLENAGVDSEI